MKRFLCSQFLVLFLMLLLFSCNKENNTVSFKGKVTEITGGGNLEGITVFFEEKKLVNGSIPINFTTLGYSTTDANGNYTFEFEKQKTIELKITTENDVFYPQSVIKKVDGLSMIEDNIQDFKLSAKAYAKFYIQNTGDSDPSDEITLIVDNDASICQKCCSAITLNAQVDTVIVCNVTGNADFDYNYLVTNESGVSFGENTIYCPAGDTTQIFITY